MKRPSAVPYPGRFAASPYCLTLPAQVSAACGQKLHAAMKELESLLQEGRSLEERRQFEEAGAVYAQAIKLHPSSGEVHLSLGRVLARERRYPEAVNAYFQAGALLLDADRLEEAQQAYSALISLEKELAAGYSPPALQRIHSRKSDVAHGMARLLYLRGAHEQALRLASTALEGEPNHVGMRTTLGLIHHEAGREAEAVEHFQAAVKLRRGTLDEARARERLATLRARQGAAGDEVHEHYLRAAVCYEREGKLEQALAACEGALQASPGHESTVIRAAGLLLTLGREEHLLARLGPASPEREQTLAQIDELYEQSGRALVAAEVRRRLEGGAPAAAPDMVLSDLVPGFSLVVPRPPATVTIGTDQGAVRLDFPPVEESAEGDAGSIWLSFHPDLATHHDVLRHMCEHLRQPAERIVAQVQRRSVPVGEVLRISRGVSLDYVVLTDPRGVLFVEAHASLPWLDWEAARLVPA